MVRSCVFCGVKSSSGSYRTFHGFPFSEPGILKKWLENMNLNLEIISDSSKLCSDHFEKTCFSKTSSKVTLVSGSVPTIFDTYKLACVYCKVKKSEGNTRTFHKFPITKENLVKKWVDNMAVPNFVPSCSTILCSDHFDRTCFYLRGTLKPTAVPTIFLPPDTEGPCLHEYGEPDFIADNGQGGEDTCTQNVEACLDGPSCILSTGEENVLCTEPAVLQPSTPSSRITDHRYAATPRSSKRKLEMTQELLEKERKNGKAQKQTLQRVKHQLSSLKVIVRELRDQGQVSENAIASLNTLAEHDVSDFLNRFFKNCNSGKISREEYPPALRSFALTLHFYSPRAYLFVREKFCKALPDPSTLRSWYSSIDGEPGFTQESFNALKMRVSDAKMEGKRVMVSFMLDEMGIKKGIQRSPNGIVRGYVDIGASHENNCEDLPAARDALVFMVVGLSEHWKLPIGYFLINGIESYTLVQLIFESLCRLHDIGVEVISVTLDGPAQHIFVLGELGVSFEMANLRPYFSHPRTGKRVYAILDACHMLKLIRNCFGDLRRFIDHEGGVIDWIFIENLMKIQETEGLRAGNKLKRDHVHYRRMKMKVSLAAQTLSNSVADAIEFCCKTLKMPEFEGSEATVQFIRCIDRVFDFLNSRNPYGKGFKAPLRQSNECFWLDSLCKEKEYLRNIRDEQGNLMHLSRRRTPFIGLISAITAVIELFNEHVKPETSQLKYLLTYKLSQDHLELFFCGIRQCGGWCPNPTCTQFVSAYKRLLVRHQIKACNGNVAAQDKTKILTVPSTRSIQGNDIYDSSVYDVAANVRVAKKYGLECEEVGNNVDQAFMEEFLIFRRLLPAHISHFREASVAYMAGWVVRKLTNKKKPIITCEQCCYALLDHCDSPNLEVLSLITIKNMGGLVYPSSSVIKICNVTEVFIRQSLHRAENHIPHESNFCSVLCSKVLFELLQPPCSLFDTFSDHMFDDAIGETNHLYILCKAVCRAYVELRMFAATQVVSRHLVGEKLRHNMTRKIIWEHQ